MLAHETPPGAEAYAFCESVTASSRIIWHIRKLDGTGLHPGGGITSTSLCKLVKSRSDGGLGGWDIQVPITPAHYPSACKKCLEVFLAEIGSTKTPADKRGRDRRDPEGSSG